MPLNLGERLKHGWNAFMNRDPTEYKYQEIGPVSTYRPDRLRLSRGNEKTIVTSKYNRIAMDVAALDIRHVRLDENERYIEDINDGLDNCLTLQANLDQTSTAFIQDAVLSLLDEGCIAIVATDTNVDIRKGSFDVLKLRTAKILEWYPKHVKVFVYNENKGQKEQIILPKDKVAIVENPLYSVMNEPNSTAKRLVRKLALLDVIDEQNSSGKLDLIIQLPYIIKTPARRQQAEERRKDIETQLAGSRYGIAYTDGTERITQLNRPVENNLLKQIEYLENLLNSQLGITQGIMDGTADEKTMLNYQTRTIKPIANAIIDAMKIVFLTKTARTQGQTIMYFKNPFEFTTAVDLASIADTFTRNEIATKNEIRQIIGWKPSDDPKADELHNSNISEPGGGMLDPMMGGPAEEPMVNEEEIQNEY